MREDWDDKNDLYIAYNCKKDLSSTLIERTKNRMLKMKTTDHHASHEEGNWKPFNGRYCYLGRRLGTFTD